MGKGSGSRASRAPVLIGETPQPSTEPPILLGERNALLYGFENRAYTQWTQESKFRQEFRDHPANTQLWNQVGSSLVDRVQYSRKVTSNLQDKGLIEWKKQSVAPSRIHYALSEEGRLMSAKIEQQIEQFLDEKGDELPIDWSWDTTFQELSYEAQIVQVLGWRNWETVDVLAMILHWPKPLVGKRATSLVEAGLVQKKLMQKVSEVNTPGPSQSERQLRLTRQGKSVRDTLFAELESAEETF